MRYVWAIYSPVFLLLLLFSSFTSAVPDEFIYPVKKSEADTRFNDVIELIETALKKTLNTDGPYTLRPARIYMSQKRTYREAINGEGMNIIWDVPDRNNIKGLIPVPFPLRKGLTGYHLLLIQKQDQPAFAEIRSLNTLKQYWPGVWSKDEGTEVFRMNGFHLVEGKSDVGLFNMLMADRFDYLPRNIHRVFQELKMKASEFPDIVVEQHLAVYYPRPLFVLVSQKHPQLADRLYRGFDIMVKDGSFNQIFFKYHRQDIQQAKLHQRHIFLLRNPFLPDGVIPFGRKELWLSDLMINPAPAGHEK